MSGVIRSIPGPTIRSCQERRDVSVMGVSFRVVQSFRFRVEDPFAALLPEREGVAIALRAGGQIEHRAIERCPIVACQFDDPGFPAEPDRTITRQNSSHYCESRLPSSHCTYNTYI